MEAFEQFVAVALETEGLVVSSAIKFPVRRRVNKNDRIEYQTHGYEVDLVGARADRLVLASVKSFFGSSGVKAREVRGEGGNVGLYRLLNDRELREAVVNAAAEQYGFRPEQVHLRLYVGKFAGKNEQDEAAVRSWCQSQTVGAGPITVVALREFIDGVRAKAESGTYLNNPVIVTMKVLRAAGLLDLSRRITQVDPDALAEGECSEDE